MNALTAFGLVAVSAMLVCYALDSRSHWWTLGFAGACMLGSTYGFLQGAWPFGLVEGVWSLVALASWRRRSRLGAGTGGGPDEGGGPMKLSPGDFPLHVRGRFLHARDDRFLFTAPDEQAAADLVERLNRDEAGRKGRPRWLRNRTVKARAGG